MGEPASRHGLAPAGFAGWGVRGEVKHLSTRRKGYSVSSGERKRIRLNRVRVIPAGGCVRGVVGTACPGAGAPGRSDKGACEANRIECRAGEGDGPVAVCARPVDDRSRVARAPWNPA